MKARINLILSIGCVAVFSATAYLTLEIMVNGGGR